MEKDHPLVVLAEKAAEAVVMIDADDMTAVAELRDLLTQMMALLASEDQPFCRNLAGESVALLQRILSRQASQPADSMTTVSQAISALQTILRDGRRPEEVSVPAGMQMACAPPPSPPTAPLPAKVEAAVAPPPAAPAPMSSTDTKPAEPALAKEMAHEPPAATAAQSLAGKYLTFKLAEEDYGLEILKVQEIIKMMDITRVPRAQAFIRGVINLRGKVIPVIDLRLKFNLSAQNATEKTCIIVVQIAQGDTASTTGLIVDEVSEVLDIAEKEIDPSPDFGASMDARFILGMAKAKGSVKILLDMAQVLTTS